MNKSYDINREQLLNWAKEVLVDELTSVEDIAVTAFSYVLKINTSDKTYYLKKTPPKLYIESSVLDVLNKECGLENVPKVIARNDNLHSFLMPSCGDLTLRTLFEDQIQIDLLYEGVNSYVGLQKATASSVHKFIEIGVPDWRVENLPNIYAAFLHDDKRLAEWGLNNEEKLRCKNSMELFEKLCADLQSLGLPSVLNHSDFHPNAMLLDQESHEIRIIDLGEVTIGNPLFPLASCITNYLEHRWQIRANEDEYIKIKSSILNQWGVQGEDVMDLVEVVGPLNYVLSFRELMELCDHNFPKWHKWIKLAFFDYLDNLENRYKGL